MNEFEATLDEFMIVYPRPSGGMVARKIIARAWHRLHYAGEDLQSVVEGARRYAKFIAAHPGRPVQDPVRWLERQEWQREWTDAGNSWQTVLEASHKRLMEDGKND